MLAVAGALLGMAGMDTRPLQGRRLLVVNRFLLAVWVVLHMDTLAPLLRVLLLESRLLALLIHQAGLEEEGVAGLLAGAVEGIQEVKAVVLAAGKAAGAGARTT